MRDIDRTMRQTGKDKSGRRRLSPLGTEASHGSHRLLPLGTEASQGSNRLSPVATEGSLDNLAYEDDSLASGEPQPCLASC